MTLLDSILRFLLGYEIFESKRVNRQLDAALEDEKQRTAELEESSRLPQPASNRFMSMSAESCEKAVTAVKISPAGTVNV